MAEKNAIPKPEPKDIMLVNKAFPGQTRRARKTELKWFAERGWKPNTGQQIPNAEKTKNA